MVIDHKKVILVIILLAAVVLIEPSLREKFTFATTYTDYPQISSEKLDIKYEKQKTELKETKKKSWAPEPGSLFLFLSGIVGMVVRFAQKSFQKFKRATDYFLAILGLTVTTPLLAFVGLLIKLNSKGPVIYKQYRVGKDGKLFEIYKLRTMRIDAEKQTGAVWAKENDPRITSVGRFLRKAHIDEIPQLFNVIKGDMSIVGPRPERPEIVRDLKLVIKDYEKRLQIKPGITGLAQVWHKYDETIEDVKKKIKYDILYIKKMCLWADLRIIAQTFIVVLIGKGAR